MRRRQLFAKPTRWTLRLRVQSPVCVLLAVAILAPCSAAAQLANRPARIEVVVPKPPTPVTVDTQRVLVYQERRGALSRATLSDAKNSAGEIVPAFICTKASILAWLPWIAANNCWVSGAGGASVAS